MPMMELKTCTKFVAAVFCLSCSTAFSLSLLRLVKPEYFYVQPLQGSKIVVHYLMCGMLVIASAIGFLNSCIIIQRRPLDNSGRNLVAWLLIDSVFETSRILYLFVCEVMLKGARDLQLYEMVVSCVQYLIDACLYNQIILKH